MPSRCFTGMFRYPVLSMLWLLMACASPETKTRQFLLKGNLAVEAGNPQQAAYYYQQAVLLNPCFADALNNLGTLAFRAGQFDQAVNYYTQALDCKPEFTAALFNRAHARFERKEYFAALADVDKVAAVYPDTSWIDFTRGLIFTRMRQFGDAKNSFSRALALAPAPSSDLLVNRATVYYYLKQYDSALNDLAQAEKINPAEANIFNTRSMIFTEQNRLDEAMAEANRALAIDPKHPYYLNNRGYIYLRQGDLNKAVSDINQSISTDPYNGWAYRNKGIFYLLSQDAPSAERVLKQALDMDPFIDRIHYYLGQAYLKNNKPDEACAAFRRSEKANDNMLTANELKRCR